MCGNNLLVGLGPKIRPTWPLGGIGWVESRLALGSILKLLLVVAGGNFPIFAVMFPTKSGTRAGGSLSEKLTQKT